MISRSWPQKGNPIRLPLAGFILLWSCFCSGPLVAQVTSASLSGTVADITGAVIPGATVTATNQASKFVRTTKTNRVGIFTFSSLDSGDYSLTIKAKDFETNIQNGIHLDPGDSRTLTVIKLAPGAETISV